MIVPIIHVSLPYCSSFLTHLATACQAFMQDEMFANWSKHGRHVCVNSHNLYVQAVEMYIMY